MEKKIETTTVEGFGFRVYKFKLYAFRVYGFKL